MTMEFGKKERDLLIGAIGIVVATLVWFLLASPLMEKTEDLKIENNSLRPKAEEYRAVAANVDEYQSQINALAEEKVEIMSHFPSAIEREDQIMFWANLDMEYPGQVALSNISLMETEVIVPEGMENSEQAAVDNSTQAGIVAGAENGVVNLYKSPVNIDFKATYSGLKDILRYLSLWNDKNTLDSISLSFDSSTGSLSGSMSLGLYFITGTEKEYVPVFIPRPDTGVKDVFRTTGIGLDIEKRGSHTSNTENDESDEDTENLENTD